jgi:hypothetical protein
MNLYQILNPEWIDQNQELISSWSPFELLWAIHHDLVLIANRDVYGPILGMSGFTGAEQKAAFSFLETCSQRIKDVVAEVDRQYVEHHISDLTHQRRSQNNGEAKVAVQMIYKLYNELREDALRRTEVGDILAQGQYGFTSDLQRELLTSASIFNKNLSAIVLCLTIWISHNEGPH